MELLDIHVYSPSSPRLTLRNINEDEVAPKILPFNKFNSNKSTNLK